MAKEAQEIQPTGITQAEAKFNTEKKTRYSGNEIVVRGDEANVRVGKLASEELPNRCQ
jgi:hypothetical protein